MDSETKSVLAADEPAFDSAGESLAQGRYVIFGQLGQGAQAETLEAVDKQTGGPVAIKRFRVGHARSWKDVELAEREARILASLNHPSLPKYFNHFEEQGNLYLVMERVEGQSLSSYVKQGHRLSVPELRSLLGTLSDVLDYLHSRLPPVIHRDIKPGNIIRRPDGSFCLVDFGSVRDGLRPDGGSTVVGTFGYMAPEQFQGRASPATDVYAVGALLLALITGRPPEELPHKGLGIDAQTAIASAVPDAWVGMISQMVNINPDERPSSLSPLIDVLDRGPDSQSDEAPPTHAAQSSTAFDPAGQDPDSSFTVIAGSGFGLVPLFALSIARIAIWAALGVAVPLVLQILSIFFGRHLRQAARKVSQAGLHARSRLADATRHLQRAEPFVLQGRHYAENKRHTRSWKAARREWKRGEREWRGAERYGRTRMGFPDFFHEMKDEAEQVRASKRDASRRRPGALFTEDDDRNRAGKTKKHNK